MLFAVLSCFALALLIPVLHGLAGRWIGWLVALLPAVLFAYFLSHLPVVQTGDALTSSIPWVPAMGLELAFRLDGLSLLFALLITGIGTLVMIYGGGYLKGHPQLGRFFVFITLFMGSMLGLVLTSNLLTLFVFWELTSITSYLLIGFSHESKESRASALQALLITAGGGLALLAGFILMGIAGGTFDMATLFAERELLHESPLYLGMLLLVLAGAFTKSAQFPFHFWLPGAMAAPTPVSAYLHSATMVKAGVYLLARLNATLGGTDAWLYLVAGVGAITMLISSFLALRHTDLKRLLAYTTVAALGTLVFLIGLGTKIALEAMVVFLLVHALYKAALFMMAGSVDHETGTRHVTELGGLGRLMPFTFIAATLAAASMAGLIPLLGFIGKELIYEATLAFHYVPWVLTVVAVASNIAVVAVAMIVVFRPFTGKLKAPQPSKVHEAPLSMWLGPLLLALLGFVFGIAPAFTATPLLVSTASAVLGEVLDFKLYLWHGFNTMLLLSLITVLLGVLVYLFWERVRPRMVGFDSVFGEGPRQGYEQMLLGLNWLASAQTRVLQSGMLRVYLMIIIGFSTVLAGATMLVKDGFVGRVSVSGVLYYEWVLVGLMVFGAAFIVLTSSRLAAVAVLGIVGYAVALIFILYGAADVAITQFFVETLSVILITLVLLLLPHVHLRVSASGRIRDAIISVGAGALVTALLLSVTALPLDLTLSEYFVRESYVAAHGRNIVNVILVDFRALDTLGEISVLAVAGIGIYTLLKLRATMKGRKGS